MKYFIQTFGCAANEADSERIASYYRARGYVSAESIDKADDVVVNTCMIRSSAEHRVYGLVHNLSNLKIVNCKLKIILTGCMVGMAVRDKTGRMLAQLKKKMPLVDEFLPIEEVGFDFAPVRTHAHHALVPITNGCNNFCTFCVVPFTRGREVSRPFDDVINECKEFAKSGHAHITLIGQNVNSYGADLLVGQKKVQAMRDDGNISTSSLSVIPAFTLSQAEGKAGIQNLSKDGFRVKPGMTKRVTYVKHLGRLRIPTLFPQLLDEICKIPGIELVDFISSNPWDFSDDLIETIAKNPKIFRHIHLPVQSGDNEVLRRMNRWYTREEYIRLTDNLKLKIENLTVGTDIIVGFCGETAEQFENTVDLARKVGFSKAYIAIYSDRPMTAAHNVYKDDVPYTEKKRRWLILENMINRENLKKGTYTKKL